ncbi:MAG: hypothetical protein ABI456_03855 [Ktedonobacteraceae bacterium]|nr:hypothetical protein [Chloroflexota bacterium]
MLKRPATWSRQFTFRDREIFYNRIPFNNRAERAVEVPLAFDFLARRQSKERMLEVGNVLQYYENALSDVLCIRGRRIIDKFEVGYGIDNIDIINVDPEEKYQTIISVSTVEHVGQNSSPTGRFGEQKKSADREAPLTAIAKIYDLLAVDGHALLTVPFGKLVDGGWYVQFSSEYLGLLTTKYNIPQEALSVGYLKRVALESRWSNPHQRWVEAAAGELSTIRYDNIASGARAIAVIELTKLAEPFTFNAAVCPATPLHYQRSPLARNLFVGVGLLRSWFHR